MALTRLGLNQAINLATNTTGTLAVANGGTGLSSGFINGTTNVGKVLQIQETFLSSNLTQTNDTAVADAITQTITLSSTSNYIMAEAFVNYQQFGANSGSTPEFQLFITDGSDNVKSTQQLLDYLKNDSSYNQHSATLFAYWSPNSTSAQTVKMRMQNPANGRALIFGNSDGNTGRASTMKLMEVSA